MNPNVFRDCWFLTGPTASGKTAVGLELAELLGAEIISLDSMAVYRGMDIGTAKPTADERRRVSHHLVDRVEPTQDFSVAQYLDEAATVVGQIAQRGRAALFVGGTPLYLKALLRGVFDGPPADWALRHELAEMAAREGHDALYARLTAIDPATAARLHPRDTRRVIRAIEVHALSGQPISQFQQQFAQPSPTSRVFCLDWPRPQLYARIDARVQAMFKAGLIDEVQGLLQTYDQLGRTAGQALGYREVTEHLAGVRDRPATEALVAQRTRQFAKRQLTWFRSLAEIQWVAMSLEETSSDVANRILGSRPADH